MVTLLNYMTLNRLPFSPNSSNSHVAKLTSCLPSKAAAAMNKGHIRVAGDAGKAARSEHLQHSSYTPPVAHDAAIAQAHSPP